MALADEVLKKSEARYEELNMLMSDPAVVADPPRYVRLVKEFTDLEPLVQDIRRIREIDQEIEDNKLLITEADEHELRELAHEEIATLEDERRQKEEAIRLALIPRDPLDEKNVIVEIRAGTGGEEAALFAADLTRMYLMQKRTIGTWKPSTAVKLSWVALRKSSFRWMAKTPTAN